MIHFFMSFLSGAKDSPFARELAALGVPHEVFPGRVGFRYRSRVALLLLGWPRLAWYALRSAITSLVRTEPPPDAVVLGSHIEVLVFGLVRALQRRRRTRLVLIGFIFTARKSRLANWLRRAYFRLVFSVADTVLCHSNLEIVRYRALFRGCRARFVYIPYGLHIWGLDEPAPAAGPRPVVLAAGRSGRDYRTLVDAVRGMPLDLHIVCDRDAALAGIALPDNVTVLRQCYGPDYVAELRRAALVAVPLAVDDISAGQMVLIQAMAFGKPTIVTRTPTVEEYTADGVESLLVPRDDAAAWRTALQRVLAEPPLAASLGQRARRAFDERYCMKAYVRHIVDALM